MNNMFTDILRKVMENAAYEAQRLNSEYIDGEHLLLGMITEGNGVGINILKNFGIDLEELKEILEESIENKNRTMVAGTIPFTDNVRNILTRAQIEAESLNFKYVGTEHLLLAMLKIKDTNIYNILLSFGLNYEKVKKELVISSKNSEERLEQKKIKTPFLDKFGRDLTQLALEDKLDPVIGREKEIERLILILCRRKKNNPILIGEPGVGKTAIVEGVAQKIARNEVSDNLKNKRIVSLDIAAMVAGTKFRGQFEERMKNILNEIANAGNVIIFIDEIHTIIGAGGSEGSLDAANILKPMLARGEIQCIGATTADEFRKYIEKDGALERRFQPIFVEPPTVAETIDILKGIVSKYEAFHNVKYTPKSLIEAAQLADRYITDRFLPDKAIDIIDEAGALMSIKNKKYPPELQDLEKKLHQISQKKQEAVTQQDFEKAAKLRDEEKRLKFEIETSKKEWEKFYKKDVTKITEEVIAEIVSNMTGIPLQKIGEDERKKLLNIEHELNKYIIGQEHAIEKLAKALRRSRAGLRASNRPIGSFIFLGPSGVGKTYTAIMLAKLLFGREDALIRLDMTEYMEKFNISRLIGAPPGYVGFQEGGQLTEKIRNRPYSVVLFDEIEKAHPDIYNILLQILDGGFITDSNGRKVSFSNSVIILTSNIGSQEIINSSRLGFNAESSLSQKDIESTLKNEVKKFFKPELINRFDDIIIFRKLKDDDFKKITEVVFNETRQRALEKNIDVLLTESAKNYIASLHKNDKAGAREIKNTIQNLIEDYISEQLLEGKIKEGDKVKIKFYRKKLKFEKI